MKLLHPEFIYLMLVPAGLLVYLIQTNKDTLERIFEPEVLQRLRIYGDALGRRGHNVLIFGAFFFMALALARPVVERQSVVIYPKSNDVAVAVDMTSPVVMREGRKRIAEAIGRLKKKTEVGVIGFDAQAYLAVPVSADLATVADLTAKMALSRPPKRPKSVLNALKASAKLLPSGGRVWMIVGAWDAKDWQAVLEIARQNRLKVAVWQMGAKEGAGAWRRLAQETGGVYADGESYARFLLWFEQSAEPAGKITKYTELFYYPLGLAVLLLPLGLFSVGRAGRVAAVLWLALAGGVPDARAGLLDFWTIRRAEEAYRQGDYRLSAKLFEALARKTNRAEAWLSLGDAYYRLGAYAKACEAYARVVTTDTRLESAKLYNLGNCYAKMGKWERAAHFYRKVLALWDDADARYNLALVKKHLPHALDKKGAKKGVSAHKKVSQNVGKPQPTESPWLIGRYVLQK
ncbi:MAG: tetratricopeptide repeat protein [Epsilonproteobacteria bacterium]|nr:tetratricopeptide repeat protein [Campylobacterota bacterium]